MLGRPRIPLLSCRVPQSRTARVVGLARLTGSPDIVAWEAGGGQAPRQPGQVRKEAAVTSSGLGRRSVSHRGSHGEARHMSEPGAVYRVLARKYRPSTFAELIARALNCVGLDGKGGPTVEPCGQCEHCRAIAEDRHVDVLEMDAASRTGVDDIREL